MNKPGSLSLRRTQKRIGKFVRVLPLVLGVALMMFGASGCDSTDTQNGVGGAGSMFDSGTIASDGGTYSYTFSEEETVEYFCEIHAPDMQGSIVVDSAAQSTNPDTVEMENLRFNPSTLTVAPNTEVVWINRDGTSHTVTSGNPDSGNGGNNGGY